MLLRCVQIPAVNNNNVDNALIDLMADQVKQTTYAACALITLVAIVILFSLQTTSVLIWAGVGYALAVPRYLLIDRVKRRMTATTSRKALESTIAIALFLSAVHWGAAGWLYLDTENVQNFALVCGAILGVIASALAIFSTRPKICILFTTTVFSMVSIKLFLIGSWGLAVMCLIVLPPYALLSKTLGRRIEVSITQDFRNAELLEEVSAANVATEKASREKSLFMAATSHDLRQPLHAQNMLLQIMKNRAKGTELEDLVEKMTASNDALITLFNALLEVSQLDAGTIEVRASHLSLSELCKSIIEEFREVAKQKGIVIELIGDECIVHSDPILLLRILRNLVSNALKFTIEGRISIALTENDSTVLLSVCDTGIGIPIADQSMIFNEYTQLDNPSRDRSKGIGLGLALVRRMCDLLDHEIRVESTPGKGSCFYLMLPVGDASSIVYLSKDSVSVRIENLDILIIDDEQSVLDAMDELFSEWHCQTRSFTSLKAAVASIEKAHYRPDLIISDYRLGENTNGVEAIAQVRKSLNEDVPALLISGDTDPLLLEEIKREKFYLLHKPVDIARLRKVIASLLPLQR